MRWHHHHRPGQKIAKAAGALLAKCLFLVIAFSLLGRLASRADVPATAQFRKDVQPILKEFCYDCHGDGAKKGDVAFDELKTDAQVLDHKLWLKVLTNVRAGLMPPEKKPHLSPAEQQRLERWIKFSAFEIDPQDPDPGRGAVRRLNRVEYRNTVRDLMGVDFNTEREFPPDDTGHGFDNIGDVLTLSPMLMEKYLDAARAIISEAVPTVPGVVAENVIAGRSFGHDGTNTVKAKEGMGNQSSNALTLSYYSAASVSNTVQIHRDGHYQLVVDLTANDRFVDNQFDYNTCQLVFRVDGKELLKREFVHEGSKPFIHKFDCDWKSGEHQMSFELHPLTQTNQVRSLSLRLNAVTVRGPFEEKFFVKPRNYDRFFPKDVPASASARRSYARELLRDFAEKAFRRPIEEATVTRLVALAEQGYSQPKQTFESGIARSMVAVLASPRFLFREEAADSSAPGEKHPLVEEYALASRLSYFLWSTMPDAELIRLAKEKALRKNLATQVKGMLADPKSSALTCAGQWRFSDRRAIEQERHGDSLRHFNRSGHRSAGRAFDSLSLAGVDMR
jgi:Protein of unknown function (DUF1587)/Protein of unknown function (DUF1595)/Protein of unknown function (DUF1592)/Planctomycete cytochrome C